MRWSSLDRDTKMALCSQSFSYGAQSQDDLNIWHLGDVEQHWQWFQTAKSGDHCHPVCGDRKVTFRQKSSQTHTVFQSPREKKAIYKHRHITICTGLFRSFFWIQEKVTMLPFSYVHRVERRCWKMIRHLRVFVWIYKLASDNKTF